jgi:hypothetical protein
MTRLPQIKAVSVGCLWIATSHLFQPGIDQGNLTVQRIQKPAPIKGTVVTHTRDQVLTMGFHSRERGPIVYFDVPVDDQFQRA